MTEQATVAPESNLIQFPTSTGIQTVGENGQPIPDSNGTTFNIEAIPRDKPILFTRDEIWQAISAVQDSRELIGQAMDLLASATVSGRQEAYKVLLQKYGTIKGILESAYAYSQLSHESIFRVLSTANIANGLTSRVEIRETVTPSQ